MHSESFLEGKEEKIELFVPNLKKSKENQQKSAQYSEQVAKDFFIDLN